MNRNQVVDLLTAISAYDNRKPNEGAIIAWGTAAEMGRWTLDEAVAAVKAHFFEETAYLMPAHVAKRIKDARQDRALRAEVLAIESGPVFPEAQARVERAVAELAAGMGWDRGARQEKFGLTVSCPHCGAKVGQKCTARTTGVQLREASMHPARAAALGRRLSGEAS